MEGEGETMKRIHKREAPESFLRWVRKNHSHNWDSLDSNVKRELAEQLRLEQGRLCCYCERRVDQDHSHIEHFKPQNDFPQEAFRYENLMASCHHKESCGTKKQHRFFPEMVCPVDKECEERFFHNAKGEIVPVEEEDKHAWETIALLGLNSRKLRESRRIKYEEYWSMKQYLSPSEFDECVREILRPNLDGEYAEFWTTIKYVAEKA